MKRVVIGILVVVLGVIGLSILRSVLDPASRLPQRSVGTPAPPLKLFVTVRLDGIQITNETEGEWEPCEVTIPGSYTARIALLSPHATVRLPFERFANDTHPVPPGEGYARGKQRVEIACSGSDYERQTQAFTDR